MTLNTNNAAQLLLRRFKALIEIFPVAGAGKQQSHPSMREVWLPESGPRVALVRWFVSEWCNYRCPYCPQTHERRAPKGNGFTAHAFDNFPVEEWQDGFDRHFDDQRLSLVITGGEPMVDRKNMAKMLAHLTNKPNVECIRIDTNAWWKPEFFDGVDFGKIILMCTFHPSQTDEDEFKRRVMAIKRAGVQIGMVNYVMTDTNIESFSRHQDEFAKLDLILHPNPLWLSDGNYSEASLEVMADAIPELDFRYRTGAGDPFGLQCNFPAVGYEVDYTGKTIVGCHPTNSGSFFDAKLPERPHSSVPCPFHSCVCLDKYSFLDGVDRNISLNPLRQYSKALKEKRLGNI